MTKVSISTLCLALRGGLPPLLSGELHSRDKHPTEGTSHMTSRLRLPARRAAALLSAIALLTCAASAIAATPVDNGTYRGALSDGGKVSLRVISGGERLHWSVAFRSASCNPRNFTSRSNTTFDRTSGTPIHSDGSYREVAHEQRTYPDRPVRLPECDPRGVQGPLRDAPPRQRAVRAARDVLPSERIDAGHLSAPADLPDRHPVARFTGRAARASQSPS